MINDINNGQKMPKEFDAVIEISAESDPVKYAIDLVSGIRRVVRFVSTGMRCPVNYGYIPQTLGQDGDPIDVCVITPYPILSGTIISCRPIGVLEMEDEKGGDWKVIAVPVTKVCPTYADWRSVDDVAPDLLKRLRHFFEHSKDLDPGRWTKVAHWKPREEAERIIEWGASAYAVKTKEAKTLRQEEQFFGGRTI